MMWFFLAPEIVLVWAARQWFNAWCISDKYQDKGWTMTHGFFFVMGGFTLHDSQGTPVRLRNFESSNRWWRRGNSNGQRLPRTRSRVEISRGSLSLTPFYLCRLCGSSTRLSIAERIGLSLAQIEVATLAYVVLAGLVYSIMWWNKPNLSWRKPLAGCL